MLRRWSFIGECVVVLLVRHVASSSLTTTSPLVAEQPGIVRLPKSLKPQHYEVRLQPFLGGNFSVAGEVKIDMTALANTHHVIMHIADIITNNSTAKVVEASNGSEQHIIQQSYSPSSSLYVVHLQEELLQGHNYTFSIAFTATLGDYPKGFYRSSYIKENGETSWVASTQFQATEARRSFPCFDEPQLKATFKIFLARKEGMTALSNMPLISSTSIAGQPGWVWDEFQTSVAMSTYLVAFAISDYPIKVVAGQQGNTTLIRVSTRQSVQEKASLAGSVAAKSLEYFTNYFNIPFPLPKTDLIAVPEHPFNGMENWGLITFRESGMLYDPRSSPAERRRWVNYLVAHELAHQWFGNLVTPAWWDDLWLNEGFATYMAFKAVNHFEPTWGMLNMFLVIRQQKIMILDALRTSHPVSRPVNDPDNINTVFDRISYSKGAAIIYMMDKFLSEATFKKGVTNYLTELQYDNANQDDLWRFLTTAGHQDGTLPANLTVKTIMDTWTLQTGFPVVTVTRTGNTSAVVTQEQFSLDKGQTSTASSPRWWVPVTLTSQTMADFTNTKVKLWLRGTDPVGTNTEMEYPHPKYWAIVNVQQSGYYRVNYDANNWQLLTQQLLLNHTAIHVANRVQIMDDAFNLARVGLVPYSVVLDLMGYLQKEREYPVWQATLNNLQYVYNMMSTDPAYGALKDYLLSLLLPVYRWVGGMESSVGGVDQDLPDQLLREQVVRWVCRLNHHECLKPAIQLYQSWMKRPELIKNVSVNVREAVSCTGVKEGGEAEWVFAWKRREELDSALGCTKDIWLLKRYLEGAVNASSGIRRQDAQHIFKRVAGESLGVLVVWDYLKAHWTKLSKYIGTTFFALPNMVKAVTASFNTQHQLHEVLEFEREHSIGGGLVTAGEAVAQAIEATQININWVKQYRHQIVNLLNAKGCNSDLANIK